VNCLEPLSERKLFSPESRFIQDVCNVFHWFAAKLQFVFNVMNVFGLTDRF